ncbi:MAG TPA: hypothetical protein VIG70_07630 [Burkholderiales bacterium]|jgi:hypothetical protein
MSRNEGAMSYSDLDKARECHGALREIFIHHPGGWADKEALYRVEKLAWQAMTLVKDAECQEKMGIVEHYAAALYSEAEHHRWRMTSLPGADFLRLQILRALVAFHGRLFAIEAARRNDVDPNAALARAPALEQGSERTG